MSTHALGDCPGLGKCENSWHAEGCDPYWIFADASGYVISGGMYDEQDAMRKTLWSGPDGPEEVWHRRSPGGRWVCES